MSDIGSLWLDWMQGGDSSLGGLYVRVMDMLKAGQTPSQIRDALVRGQHISETDVLLAWFAIKLGIAP